MTGSLTLTVSPKSPWSLLHLLAPHPAVSSFGRLWTPARESVAALATAGIRNPSCERTSGKFPVFVSAIGLEV
jgi:hypothetical protein